MQRDELVDELKDLAEENWAYGRTRTAKALEQAAAELARLREPASFEEWFDEYDKQNHHPEMLARAAWDAAMLAAAPTPQQPVSDDAAPTPQKGVSDG